MAKPRGQAYQFRVKAPNSSLYYLVRIFKSQQDLTHMAGEPKWIAAVISKPHFRLRAGARVLSTKVGEVYFCYGHLDIDTIAHEAAHMAIGITARKGRKIIGEDKDDHVSDEEEDFCYMVGHFAAQINVKLQQLQLK